MSLCNTEISCYGWGVHPPKTNGKWKQRKLLPQRRYWGRPSAVEALPSCLPRHTLNRPSQETEPLSRVTGPEPRCCVRCPPRPEGQRASEGPLVRPAPEQTLTKSFEGQLAQRPAHLEAIRALGTEDSGGGQEEGRGTWGACTHLLLIKPELWTGPQPWKSCVPARSSHPQTSHPPHRDRAAAHKIHEEGWG